MLHEPTAADLPPSDPPVGDAAARRQIDGLLDALDRLARGGLADADFFVRLLQTTVEGLAAMAGAAWRVGADGRWRLAGSVSMEANGLDGYLAETAQHAGLLAEVAVAGDPRLAAAELPASNGDGARPLLLLLAPIGTGQAALGVIEIFQRGGTSPAAQQGYLKFVAAAAEAAGLFLRGDLIPAEPAVSRLDRFDTFVRQIHLSLDPLATAYALANEGRLLVDCDRLSVVRLDGGRPRLLAVSGLDTFDRRANFAQSLEKLVRLLAPTGEALWLDEHSDLPPQLDAAVEAQLDASQARTLAILPLAAAPLDASRPARQQLVGALAIECFDARRLDEPFRQRAAAVAEHGGLALANALRYRRVPLMRVWQVLDRARWFVRVRQLPWTILALAGAAAAAVALALVPADFDVAARGQLQPVVRREVFASSDGEVAEVRVKHAQQVAAGEVVAVLRRPQLTMEFSRITGEMQTARRRLDSIQAARLGGDGTRNDTPEKAQQLTAEEEEIKTLLTGLEQQKALLVAQQAELDLRSPIAGEVLTWDVVPLLLARPVQRGQSLVAVADTAGAWQLEVRIDDDRVGQVVAARQAGRAPLAVTYILATDPNVSYRGKLDHLALAAETDKANSTSVLATVAIERGDLPDPRPGASVIAKIHCGRRSIGYVWFHELWQAIQARLF